MKLNYFRFNNYSSSIATQSLQAAAPFLTGSNAQYWAGKGNNCGVIAGYDWVPSSGSLKLIEFNTNIQTPPEPNFLDSAVTWWKANNYDTIVLVTRNEEENVQPPLGIVGDITASLASSGLTSSIYVQDEYPAVVPDFDVPNTTFVLRFGFDSASPIDYLASDKREFRNFASSSGFESLMPRKIADLPTVFSNGVGVPDVLIKDPTEDNQTLVMNWFQFYDITDDNKDYLLSQSYCEEFILPDLNYNGAYYSELRGVVMLTPQENIFLQPRGSITADTNVTQTQLPCYILSGDSGSYATTIITRRGAMTGSQVLMSDDSHTNIENVVTGSFLKVRNISGLPDESDGYANKCGNYRWKLWETSSLSIPSQSNVEVINNWSDSFTDSYTVINGDKKFGTFTNLLTSGSENKWKFKPTIELSVGDYLAGEDGQPLKITSVSVVSSSTEVFPITELNVEPQDYYYANGVIVHNAACVSNYWVSATYYVEYDEVFWPFTWGSAGRCHYYSNANMNQGHTPGYTESKGTITACTTDSWWIAKGLCDVA
jgi:hypothetical protein